LEYLGFLPCFRKNCLPWRASLSVPVSKPAKSVSSHLKYRAVGNFPLFKWVISLRRRLVLLPVYMIDFLALASSYAPSSCDSLSKFPRVNFRHLPLIGIIPLLLVIDANHRLAYPLAERLEDRANGNSVTKGDNRNGI